MKKDDKVTIMLFFIVILLIILLVIYHDFENRRIPVDRKVNYIFDKYPHENVLKTSEDLFFKAIQIYNTDNLTYEKQEDNFVLYKFGNYDKYKKIINPDEINNIYTKEETAKYRKDKNIYSFDNAYYIEDSHNNYNKRYVGSIINLSHWDEEFAYFDTENFYCDDYEYVGLIDTLPACDFETTNTSFSVTLENEELLLSSYADIKAIIK